MKEKVEELIKISSRVEALKAILIEEVKIIALQIARSWEFHPYKDIPDDLDNFEDSFEVDDDNIIISWQFMGRSTPVRFPAKCLYNESELIFCKDAIRREVERARRNLEIEVQKSELHELKRLLMKYPEHERKENSSN